MTPRRRSGPRAATSDYGTLCGPRGKASEVDIPEVEHEVFDLRLRNLWREKDRLMGRFVKTGPVATMVPVRLKHSYEVRSRVAARGVDGGMTYVGSCTL